MLPAGERGRATPQLRSLSESVRRNRAQARWCGETLKVPHIRAGTLILGLSTKQSRRNRHG